MALKTITSDDLDFNYEVLKAKYTVRVNRFLQMQGESAPYTREWINKTMQKVKNCRNIESTNPTTPCHPVKIKDCLYDVLTINGVEKLVCIKYKKVLQVLNNEESFNVFVDFHLRDAHCRGKGFSRMYNVLSNYFDFSHIFLESFMKSCNVCAKLPNNNAVTEMNDENIRDDMFNSLVQIIFMDMSSCLNKPHEYKYLLVHRETVSGYVLLRPLTELDAGEIASELYKIFVDFGPPETIQTTHPDFLKDVFIILKKSPIKYKTLVSDDVLDGNDIKYKVIYYINKWMECSNCSDWPLTCYVVQFSMNTEGDNAMEQVFGKRIAQTAKRVLFSKKNNEKKVKCEVQPLTKDHNSRDSASSVSSIDEDMSGIGNINSAERSSTSMDTESKNFVECGSTSTAQSTDKPERLKCVVCDRVFLFTSNIYTCNKCKKFVHRYCGYKVVADSEYFEEIEVICKSCSNYEPDVEVL